MPVRRLAANALSQPGRFVQLGIDPPKGVLLYGPPGTGKTLCARAVANRTDATFIRVIGSELVQKYVGEGARLVRELFEMARSKKACIIFIDEVDAIVSLGEVCTRSGAESDVLLVTHRVVLALTTAPAETTRCSERCSSSSTSWTASMQEVTSRC